MEFRTAYGEKLETWSPTGEKYEMRHNAVMDVDGRRELVKNRKVPIYELIQASREECEIENIIRRAVMGDANALNAKQGVYADVTGMPKSIAEAQQMIINLKEEFEKLPKELKAKFENNAEIYVAEFGSEAWAEKTGLKEKLKKAEEHKAAMESYNKNLVLAAQKLAEGEVITQKGTEE